MNKNKHIIITRSRIRKMCERAYFKIKQERLDELLRINHLLNLRLKYYEIF